MAVGDVISEISPVSGTTAYFQPSAGTEIIVTWVSSQGVGYAGLYNGVNSSIGYTAYNTTAGMNGKTTRIIIFPLSCCNGYLFN